MSGESVKAVFSGILSGIREALDDAGIVIPVSASSLAESEVSVLADWPLLCKAVWFPYHANNCRSARCAACSPVLLASSRVCRAGGEGEVSSDCMDNVMGPGLCNACTHQFISNL